MPAPSLLPAVRGAMGASAIERQRPWPHDVCCMYACVAIEKNQREVVVNERSCRVKASKARWRHLPTVNGGTLQNCCCLLATGTFFFSIETPSISTVLIGDYS